MKLTKQEAIKIIRDHLNLSKDVEIEIDLGNGLAGIAGGGLLGSKEPITGGITLYKSGCTVAHIHGKCNWNGKVNNNPMCGIHDTIKNCNCYDNQ